MVYYFGLIQMYQAIHPDKQLPKAWLAGGWEPQFFYKHYTGVFLRYED